MRSWLAQVSGVATFAIPGSPGIPASVAAQTLVIPFNDLAAAEAVFAAHGDKIAGVILEPIAGNMGCIPPVPGYLEGLRSLTTAHGSVLIFDEVMCGFLRGSWERTRAIWGTSRLNDDG